MSFALSASASLTPLLSEPPKGWTFSAAPAVITFLAVPGDPTVLVPDPALPAAKTKVICWLPVVTTADPVGCASRTSRS